MLNHKKILIIEKNECDRRLVRMTLSFDNYLLLEADDGERGLALALKENPDLIIMDVRLPGLNGLQVVGRLRATPGFEDTPIIAVTASAMKGDKEKILAAGYSAYLSKPIHIKTLENQVKKILGA